MTNMMQDGASWLGEKLQDHVGRTITIDTGTQTFGPITAAVVEHEYEIYDNEGFFTKVLSYDWTIVASDLTVTLKPGDRITETLDGVTSIYEIVPLSNRPAVEMQDTSNIILKIHTKKVA